MKILNFAFALAALAIGGCQHTGDATPAVLADASEPSMQALKSALASALGRSQVELGASDPMHIPRVSVLPPPLSPLEDRSPVKPALFDLFIRNGSCFAIQVETKIETELTNVPCRPL